MTDNFHILIRCDGSSRVGMGHIVRCLALADELRERYYCEVAFAVQEDEIGINLINKHNYRVFTPIENNLKFDYYSWIIEVIEEFQPHVFILDVRDELPIKAILEMKERKIKIVTIDDPSDRRRFTDLAFYPPIYQVGKLDWTGYDGKLFVGWDWILLRPEFSIQKTIKKTDKMNPIILVAMGGSDPQGMTLNVIRAIEKCEREIFVKIILGPAFSHYDVLLDLLKDTRQNYEILINVENMADIMRGVDVAVVSFGVTAYELAALDIPSVYLCISPDHSESAQSLADQGYGVNLGEYPKITKIEICKAINTVLKYFDSGRNRKEEPKKSIDGRGYKRISQKIIEEISK